MLRDRPYVPCPSGLSSAAAAHHPDIHEGTPLGSFEILHGVRTYVSDPKPVTGGQKQNVIVLIPDIFGVDLVNSKLQADSWAQDGWKVLMPDVLEGDAIDHSLLKVGPTLGIQVTK